jgi:hypothetical protein
MQRLGGTLPPTVTPVQGPIAPTAPPGEPGAAESAIKDAANPTGVTRQGDEWPDLLFADLFERPYGSNGVYLPDLDLTRAGLSVEGDWVYVTLTLAQPPVPGSGMHYSVEFDTDLDARPDTLVTAFPRADAAWDSRGMRVYLDPDKNVGGDQPKLAEPPAAEWDGFEVQRQDAITATPALVWYRPAPGDANAVQFAVFLWMLGEPNAFAWRAWAEGAGFNPGRQDYNDFHILEQAGSPYVARAYYPSRDTVATDNTCVAAYGFELEEPPPGYCSTAVEALPAGSFPLDDLVYAEGGEGVTLTLSSGATKKIPGALHAATQVP